MGLFRCLSTVVSSDTGVTYSQIQSSVISASINKGERVTRQTSVLMIIRPIKTAAGKVTKQINNGMSQVIKYLLRSLWAARRPKWIKADVLPSSEESIWEMISVLSAVTLVRALSNLSSTLTQVIRGVGSPPAWQWNSTVFPWVSMVSSGDWVITGGSANVRRDVTNAATEVSHQLMGNIGTAEWQENVPNVLKV